MADKDYKDIPKEMFEFANVGEKLSDKKLDTKPIGYFKDAWLRFKKNKASVLASVIILIIILYALLVPLFSFRYDVTFMDAYYAKKGPRNTTLRKIGLADGGTDREFSEKGLISAYSIGMAALDTDGSGDVRLSDSIGDEMQPILKIKSEEKKAGRTVYTARIDTYLEVGFIYKSIEQSEYAKIVEWEKETGRKVLYPLVNSNEYNMNPLDANYWYKTDKSGNPIRINDYGQEVRISLSDNMKLEDNYKRDENGNPVYWEYSGGGTTTTAQYKVRLLYYNYYIYSNGFEPNYIMGTDSQGYDLALRIADGIRLSLMIAVFVSVINFVIGAIYGAIEGYYGDRPRDGEVVRYTFGRSFHSRGNAFPDTPRDKSGRDTKPSVRFCHDWVDRHGGERPYAVLQIQKAGIRYGGKDSRRERRKDYMEAYFPQLPRHDNHVVGARHSQRHFLRKYAQLPRHSQSRRSGRDEPRHLAFGREQYMDELSAPYDFPGDNHIPAYDMFQFVRQRSERRVQPVAARSGGLIWARYYK